jgi:hypothetical protein
VPQAPLTPRFDGLQAGFVPGRVAPARILPLSRARSSLRPARAPAGSLPHRARFRVLPRAFCRPGLAQRQPAGRMGRGGSAPRRACRVWRSGPSMDDPLRVWRGSQRVLRCRQRFAPRRHSGCRSSRSDRCVESPSPSSPPAPGAGTRAARSCRPALQVPWDWARERAAGAACAAAARAPSSPLRGALTPPAPSPHGTPAAQPRCRRRWCRPA